MARAVPLDAPVEIRKLTRVLRRAKTGGLPAVDEIRYVKG
jgi:hypothetical protein